MSALVVDLGQVGRHDLAVAGGKGANLGELVRAGFPVPPGFLLTTAAYDRFVAHNRLAEAIVHAPGAGSRVDGAAIRAAFERAAIPPEVEQACRAAYDRLGRGAVAVRSSATAEDLPGAAFAGQQETFLNVVGAEALLDAVRRCWASLWGDRAIAYRARLGMAEEPVRLAVVVQRLVDAEVAGVLFTADPVSGERRDMVLDASPGLGEAVVSGLVTPDHYVLRKARWGWRVVGRQRGRREVLVRARAGGGTEQVTPDAGAVPPPVLTDRALRRLARLGAAIERHFGAPQDVEWAWRQGRPFILQARPMTALPAAAPPHLPRPLASMAAELLPVRPYPLDVTAWGPAVFQAVAPMFEALGLEVAPLERVFRVEDGVALGLSGRLPIRPTPRVLLAPVRLARLSRAYDPARWEADPRLAEALTQTQTIEARDPGALSWDGLFEALRAALALPRVLAGDVRQRYFPRAALALGLLLVLLQLAGRRDRLGALLSGVETKTLQVNRALETLAAQVRSTPPLADLFARHEAGALWVALGQDPAGRAWLADLSAFLARYGHREAAITTASLPTWGEAPEVVLGIVKGLALQPPRPSDVQQPDWQRARDEVLASPWMAVPPLRAVFLGLLRTARYLLLIREDTHFYATLALPLVRRTVLEMGRRLVQVGALEAPTDVFHLTMADLERPRGAWPPPPSLAGELRARVQRRIARRALLAATPLVEVRSEPGALADPGVLLRGSPGSPGVAEGPVRVIHDGAAFGTLKPGEVLVAPFTNPAWTPLFQRAAAVVVDTGGAGSHAAIVAREYGIPAVMGTANGTTRLVDGQRVRVDGSRGIVAAVDIAGEGLAPDAG